MSDDPQTGLVLMRTLLPRRYARLARVHLNTLWSSSPDVQLECRRLTHEARGEPIEAETTFWPNAIKVGPAEDVVE